MERVYGKFQYLRYHLTLYLIVQGIKSKNRGNTIIFSYKSYFTPCYKWTYRLPINHCIVATLLRLYLTKTGITMSSVKSIKTL